MKFKNYCKATASLSRKIKMMVVAFLVIMVINPNNNVQAQVPVTDALTQGNLWAQRVQDFTEYGEEATRWKATLDHHKQQLVKTQGLVTKLAMEKGLSMQEVDADTYQVAERCGGALNVQALTQVFNIDGAGDVYKQQKQICANIQRAHNMKYNVTVRYMRDTIPALEGMLREMEKERNQDNSQGNVEAATSKANQMSNHLNVRYQNWQSQIQTYDAYVQAMTETQKLLARNALKGNQGILGAVIRTVSLRAALGL